MKIFDLVDTKVVFDTSLLLVPEFKVIWDEDKAKDKNKAFKTFAYIYFMVDPASPYSNFPLDKRRTAVGQDMFKGEIEETAGIKGAMDKYSELSETPSQRLLNSVKYKIDEIANYLQNTPYTDDNATAQLKSIESTSKLTAQLTILQDAVNKEKSSESTKRSGDKRTRKYED